MSNPTILPQAPSNISTAKVKPTAIPTPDEEVFGFVV